MDVKEKYQKFTKFLIILLQNDKQINTFIENGFHLRFEKPIEIFDIHTACIPNLVKIDAPI